MPQLQNGNFLLGEWVLSRTEHVYLHARELEIDGLDEMTVAERAEWEVDFHKGFTSGRLLGMIAQPVTRHCLFTTPVSTTVDPAGTMLIRVVFMEAWEPYGLDTELQQWIPLTEWQALLDWQAGAVAEFYQN